MQVSQAAAAAPTDNSDLVDMAVLVTSDTDYSNVEIGDLNEERSELSTLSHSSSAETLLSIKSLSPKRQPRPSAEGSGGALGSVQHDMNGNPEYDQLEQEEEDADADADADPSDEAQGPLAQAGAGTGTTTTTPSQASKDAGGGDRALDVGSLLDADELPLLYVLRLVCRSFLLRGEEGQLVHDRHVRVSLKSLALGCVASVFSLCPRLVLEKLVPSDLFGETACVCVCCCVWLGVGTCLHLWLAGL